MKKQMMKLTLNRETLHRLELEDLGKAAGGRPVETVDITDAASCFTYQNCG